MDRWVELGREPPRVCRLGLASRGNTHLDAPSVLEAVDRGINFLNWCGHGHDDGLCEAVRRLKHRRRQIFVATQLYARSAGGILEELEGALNTLQSHYIDLATFYYLETEAEWQQVIGKGGALEGLRQACRHGKLRFVGVTSHQRRRATAWAGSGFLDALMVRYNTAHRGAEQDVFPVTERLKVPVITYTTLRWGGLLESTPEDPAGFRPPPAREWLRFALANPAVSVVLTAPDDAGEMRQNLEILEDWRPPTSAELESLRAHGDRVRRHAGRFP